MKGLDEETKGLLEDAQKEVDEARRATTDVYSLAVKANYEARRALEALEKEGAIPREGSGKESGPSVAEQSREGSQEPEEKEKGVPSRRSFAGWGSCTW